MENPWGALARRGAPLLVARGITLATTLVAFALVGRYLGPERFGVYSLAYSLPILVTPLIDFGFGSVVTRELARGATLMWVTGGLVSSCIALLAVWPVLLGGVWLYGLRGHEILLVLASSLQLPTLALRPLEARLVAEKRTNELGVFAVAGRALSLMAVLMVIRRSAAEAIVMVAHISHLVIYYGLIAWRGVIGLRVDGSSVLWARRVWREAWPFGVGGIFASVFGQSGVVVVFLVAGAAAAGLYSASQRFYEISVMIAGVAMTIVFPLLSEAGRDRPVLFRQTISLLRGMMAASGLAVLGIVAIAPEVLRLTFGSQYVLAGPVLVALAPAIVNVLPGNLLGHASIATGLRMAFLESTAGAAFIAVVAGAGLTAVAGPAGAAIGLALAGSAAIAWIGLKLTAGTGRPVLQCYLALYGVWCLAFLVVVMASLVVSGWERAGIGLAAGTFYAWYAYSKR